MAKKFEAPLRFLTKPGIMAWADDNKIHLVSHEEHTTLVCCTEEAIGDIDICVSLLQSNIASGESYDEVMKSLRLFAALDAGSCLMGDLKPGLLWDYADEDYRDIWKDGLKWDRWVSQEYIAQEYYAREQRRQKR
jgi:hypothetical protein